MGNRQLPFSMMQFFDDTIFTSKQK